MKKLIRPIAAILAVSCQTAGADIVAWYHFDEEPTGKVSTDETVLINSVDPTKGAGFCRVFKYNRASYSKQPTIDTEPSELMPSYVDGVPENIAFYDPITETMSHNRRALSCTSSNPSKLTSADGSIVYLADAELHQSQAFTVEFFVKIAAETPDWTDLIAKYAGGYSNGHRIFGVTLQASRKPVLYVRTATKEYSTSPQGCPSIGDGKWHHIAIVVDTAAKVAKLHVDSSVLSVALEGVIDYTDAGPLTFAASPNSYIAPIACSIDEVRIADTALGASQLLSARVRAPVSPLTNNRTLVYVDFSDSLDEINAPGLVAGTETYVPALLNRAPYNAAYDKTQMQFYWSPSSGVHEEASRKLIDDVPKSELRIGTSMQCVTNESAYWSGVADAGAENPAVPLLGINGTERYIYEDSFTMEFFLNCGTEERFDIGKHKNSYIAGQAGSEGEVWCIFSPGEGRLSFFFGGKSMVLDEASDAGGVVSKKKFNDGKWHHYAFVYDKSTGRLDVYVDYRHFGGADEITFGTPRGVFGQMSFLGYYYLNSTWADYSSYAMSNAKFDELRITRGVLTTEEFLRSPKKGMMLIVR